jgi:radical SAM protein with 4Fe4S-binding SPASM domain
MCRGREVDDVIGISKLYCGTAEPHDELRYGSPRDGGPRTGPPARGTLAANRPVVVWNSTRSCNLRCVHCYSGSDSGRAPDEMTTAEAEAFIDDLAAFGAPVLLFSGGEPLLRKDVLPLIRRATAAGLRAALSTNGTLINDRTAAELKDAGLAYAGISLDGLRETHDAFRGAPGTFDRVMGALEASRRAGLRVGLRLTITRRNVADVPGVFRLMQERRIPRICFYHLVYTGRGDDLRADELSADEARATVDRIIDETARVHREGFPAEVLTVDNHADGVWLYRRLLREDPVRAAEVWALLARNGGNASGQRIACVGWNGDVYPDQFWRTRVLGNVRREPFSTIWSSDHPLLVGLRSRRGRLGGKCSRCAYIAACNGNFRVRAEAVHGDPWAEDPSCYLTEEEIAGPAPAGAPRDAAGRPESPGGCCASTG